MELRRFFDQPGSWPGLRGDTRPSKGIPRPLQGDRDGQRPHTRPRQEKLLRAQQGALRRASIAGQAGALPRGGTRAELSDPPRDTRRLPQPPRHVRYLRTERTTHPDQHPCGRERHLYPPGGVVRGALVRHRAGIHFAGLDNALAPRMAQGWLSGSARTLLLRYRCGQDVRTKHR